MPRPQLPVCFGFTMVTAVQTVLEVHRLALPNHRHLELLLDRMSINQQAASIECRTTATNCNSLQRTFDPDLNLYLGLPSSLYGTEMNFPANYKSIWHFKLKKIP